MCIVCAIVNCETDNIYEQSEDYVNEDKIRNLSILEGEAKFLAYQMLNPYEKLFVWKQRHTEILTSTTYQLSKKQFDFINFMYDGLTMELFKEDATEESKRYYGEYLPKMKEKGLALFTKEQMNIFFSNFSSETSYPNLENSYTNNSNDVHCNCSTVDDWCSGRASCHGWFCDTRDRGCGWWLQEICNGFCATNDFTTP